MNVMETKKCFKCGIEKSLNDFYKHNQMSDGHVNKCKECNKKDVRVNYEKNIQSNEYVEKERERGRSKYAKYKYKQKHDYLKINRDTARDLKNKNINLKCKEIHHWSYLKEYKNDVFILNPRAHSLVHKDLKYEIEYNCFRVKSTDKLLLSKKDMFEYIKFIFNENQVNYEIDKYPIE